LPAASLEKLIEGFKNLGIDKGKETEETTTPHGRKGEPASMFLTLAPDSDNTA
jgi:hypothetical protein